jgi:hypothetical protein
MSYRTNQQIIDKIEHSGGDNLTPEDLRYIQEGFEMANEMEDYPDFNNTYAWIMWIVFLVILTTGFFIGLLV